MACADFALYALKCKNHMTRGDSSRRPRYEIVVAGILFLLVAAYFTYASGLGYVRQLHASRAFLPVSTSVVSSKVVTHGSNSTTHGASFSPRILYRYSVGKNEYESDRFAFAGQGWRTYASAQNVVERYPAGKIAQAYFNPRNPGEAVVDPTPPPLIMLLFPVPFLLLGIVAIYAGIRGRMEKQKS